MTDSKIPHNIERRSWAMPSNATRYFSHQGWDSKGRRYLISHPSSRRYIAVLVDDSTVGGHNYKSLVAPTLVALGKLLEET